MKKTDKYHRWVEWSEEDRCYIGRCPDLFGGGVHDDDSLKCAEALEHAIEDVGSDYQKKENWPPAKVRPLIVEEAC